MLKGQGCFDVIFSWSALFRGHVYKVMSCIQGHHCLRESGLFRGHVFKVRVVYRSCLQGQGCLEVMSSRSGLFRESGLFRGHVFKVRVV